MNVDDATLAALREALDEAVRDGDARAESIARVNIACALLQMGADRARPAFEEALASVRRAQNPRSEAILSMFFAPHFVEIGDAARALALAQRARDIAERGRKGHQVLSLIQLARVLYAGFSDTERAGSAVDAAVALLAEGDIDHPTDAEVVRQAAPMAARAALDAGDTTRALELMRIVNPETVAQLERERPEPSGRLTPEQAEALDAVYAQWRARHASSPAVRISDMARKTEELLGWDGDRARAAGCSGDGASLRAFVERVQAVAAGARGMEEALGDEPAGLTDDDLVLVLGLATDAEYNRMLPAWPTFELVAGAASDHALAGRCFRLAAAIGHRQRDPRESLGLFERADRALEDGADDALRADVANEMAVCHLNLDQAEPAMEHARRAVELARRVGEDRLERMARGNVANALLRLQRVEDALEVFDGLEQDQLAAGEAQMAAVTRQNIEAVRALLERGR